MAKNLLIIGNGFDLDLGLKTSYSQYIENAKKCSVMQRNGLFNAICERYDKCNWIDIEMFIKEYVIDLSNGKIENINIAKEFKELREDLCAYMRSEIWKDADTMKRLTPYNRYSNAAKIFKSASKAEEFEVLSFNYTDMGDLADRLEIEKRPKCSYVHGEAKQNNIVFGTDDIRKIKSEYSFVLKSVQKKKTNSVGEKLNNANNIIIFGHSLGETDYHYFSDFFKRQSNMDIGNFKKKTIYIFTKNEQDAYNQLSEMSAEVNYQRLVDANNFHLFTEDDATEIEDACKEIEMW